MCSSDPLARDASGRHPHSGRYRRSQSTRLVLLSPVVQLDPFFLASFPASRRRRVAPSSSGLSSSSFPISGRSSSSTRSPGQSPRPQIEASLLLGRAHRCRRVTAAGWRGSPLCRAGGGEPRWLVCWSPAPAAAAGSPRCSAAGHNSVLLPLPPATSWCCWRRPPLRAAAAGELYLLPFMYFSEDCFFALLKV